MGADPKKLRGPIEQLQEMASKARRGPQEVKLMTALPLGEAERTMERIHELSEVGVTSVVHGARYATIGEFEDAAGRLSECKRAL